MNEHKELQLKTENQAEAKLFNFRPIFFCAVALCVGIVFGYYRYFHELSLWWLLALLPVVILSVAFARDKRLAVLAVAVLVIAFSLGNGLWSAQIRTYTDVKGYDGEFTVRGRVVESSVSKSYCTLVLDEVKIGEKGEEGKLVAYMPTAFYYTVRLSDEISIYGKVRPMTDVRENIYFATSVYDDIRFRLSSVDIERFETLGHKADIFLDTRQRIVDTLFAGMDETSASVTMAVLLGDTSTMEQSLLSNMRYGGIAHVFAVSGLHVGALYAFCRMLIQRSPLSQAPKPVCFFVLAALLLFYGGVCGYSASVVRAIVVCLAYDIGKRSGFLSDSLENMGLAAIVLLCLSPVALFTVGFQLSFAASLGIILLSKNIYALFEKGKETLVRVCTGKTPTPVSPLDDKPPLGVRGRIVRSVFSFLSVTLSAQIATAPLTLYVFGYLSVWSLFLNCLFVPIVSIIFSAVLALVVVACILPLTVSGIVLYLPSVVWSALLLVFQTFDLSADLIQGVSLNAPLLLVYYTALLFCTDKWNVPKKAARALVGICFAAFLLGIVLLNR